MIYIYHMMIYMMITDAGYYILASMTQITKTR